MEIATLTRECLARFQSLQHHDVEDEYGRLRVWAGNVSAHRTGRRSLEYRLRDASNLRTTVSNLLQDLSAILEQLQTLQTQQAIKEPGPEADEISYEREGTSSDGGDEDTDLLALDSETRSVGDMFDQGLDEAHEVITCL